MVSSNSTSSFETISRWFPLAVAASVGVWIAYRSRLDPALGIRHVTLVIGAALWLVAALAIALGPSHKTLSHRLTTARGTALLAGGLFLLSGITGIVFGGVAFAWLPVLLAFAHIALASANPRRTLFTLIFIPSLTLLLLDGVFAAVRNTRGLAYTPVLQPLARYLYSLDWTTVHLLPECGEYDPELTYRLRPGTCRFSELEFDTEYQVNSLGVRDDEASLDGPRIVVLGDSFAMGWGVAQREAFPSVLEALSGGKVLNAAVSSYATAREFGMLGRIDLSHARYLIVQYAGNDAEENRLYGANGNHIPLRDRGWYEDQVRAHTRNRSYRPGKYAYEIYRAWLGTPIAVRLYRLGWPNPRPEEFPGLPRLPNEHAQHARHRATLVAGRSDVPWRLASDPPSERSPLDAETAAFLNVVATSPVDISGLQVIILSFDFDHRRPRPFINALRAAIEQHAQISHWRNIHLLDVMPLLGQEYYLTIDSHLTPQGHEKVADELLDAIQSLGPVSPQTAAW